MADFREVYSQYQQAFRKQLLDTLYVFSPYAFEHFARKLLLAYGFSNVEVTQASKDGGIDGYGDLKLGLATMRAAFQCKRWKGNVSRPDVDKFRGAIQGEFEQGIFFTTGDFTKEAKDASLKKGAVPIILLNGDSILDLMIEKELGVERTPVYMLHECLHEFMEEVEQSTLPQVKATTNAGNTPNYDRAFYAQKYNPQSVDAFYKCIAEVENIIAEKGWKLEKKFNCYYCAFKVGFFNAFGVSWIGTKTFAIFARTTKDEAAALKVPFTKYSDREGSVYYYVEPGNTATAAFLPVFELAYAKLTGQSIVSQ